MYAICYYDINRHVASIVAVEMLVTFSTKDSGYELLSRNIKYSPFCVLCVTWLSLNGAPVKKKVSKCTPEW